MYVDAQHICHDQTHVCKHMCANCTICNWANYIGSIMLWADHNMQGMGTKQVPGEPASLAAAAVAAISGPCKGQLSVTYIQIQISDCTNVTWRHVACWTDPFPRSISAGNIQSLNRWLRIASQPITPPAKQETYLDQIPKSICEHNSAAFVSRSCYTCCDKPVLRKRGPLVPRALAHSVVRVEITAAWCLVIRGLRAACLCLTTLAACASHSWCCVAW